MARIDSINFFLSIDWSHTWERQQEIISRLSSVTALQSHIFSPLGMIPADPLALCLRGIKAIGARNNRRLGIANKLPNNAHYHRHFKSNLWLRSSCISQLQAKYIKSKHNLRDGRYIFWGAYINPVTYEIFSKAAIKILDLSERRQFNPLVPDFIKDLERKSVKEADLVIVDNRATQKDYANDNSQINYIPQGFNPSEFSSQLASDSPKERLIGYIGNLHSTIDYDYLIQLIKINWDWNFLFVGNILDSKAARLLVEPNVSWHPAVPKPELIRFLHKMQFGLIPYLRTEYSSGVFPTKLLEYLASNVPVISTSIPEVMRFSGIKNIYFLDTPRRIDIAPYFEDISGFLIKHTWDARFDEYVTKLLNVDPIFDLLDSRKIIAKEA